MTSVQFFARMIALLDEVLPSCVILPGWTYNDCRSDGIVDEATVRLFYARLLWAAEACRQRGILPLFLTPFPRDAQHMHGETLNGWRWIRERILEQRADGAIVIDTSLLLAQSDANGLNGLYKPAFSFDDVHPNDDGHEYVSAYLEHLLTAENGEFYR